MMGFKQWLAEALTPPCIHHWDKVAELRHPDQPESAATIIRMCRHCGETDETVFRAPDPGCKHEWNDHTGFDIICTTDFKKQKIGEVVILKCKKCGDLTERRFSVHG